LIPYADFPKSSDHSNHKVAVFVQSFIFLAKGNKGEEQETARRNVTVEQE
jgi:hypothetical protein